MFKPLLIALLLTGNAIVIDGDTIEINSQRIRLWGIDAPERNTAQGEAARVFLGRALAGQTVNCNDLGERSYERIVAMCFVNGEDIAWIMVNAGHAKDWPRYSKGYYRHKP